VPEHEIALGREGTSADPNVAELVVFGQQILVAPAEVSDEQIEDLRAFGYTDQQIAEVPALVALNMMTGAFNLVAALRLATPAADRAE